MEEQGVKKELLAKALNLKDLAAYQVQSIVSREIIKKAAGTVTVFAFDEGEGLSEHTAPFDALVHVLEGTAEVAIEGTPHTVQAGEMIIMPAHKAACTEGRIQVQDAARDGEITGTTKKNACMRPPKRLFSPKRVQIGFLHEEDVPFHP